MTASLRLRNYGVAFGDSVVLAEIDLDLGPSGITVLVGPVASGKSTLLRTLAGLNDNHPSLRVWGEIEPPRPRPSMVVQHARFFVDSVRENLVSALPERASLERREQTRRAILHLERCGVPELANQLDRDAVSLPLPVQRQLAIVRAAMSNPPVIFADEVDAGLEPLAAAEVVDTLSHVARRSAVVFVTHNQRNARAAGGTTMLLAGGRLHEVSPTDQFFDHPTTDLGRQFVRTGGCCVASIGTPASELEEWVEPTPPPPEAVDEIGFRGPKGFFWLRPDALGGTRRPGLLHDLEEELRDLRRLGVNRLVNLEETETVERLEMERAGIRGYHFPIDDMDVPQVEDAIDLCSRLSRWLLDGERIAVHCRAGLGRTGTILACQLIWEGWCAREAFERLREINPRCIQSTKQVNFLRIFELATNSITREKEIQWR